MAFSTPDFYLNLSICYTLMLSQIWEHILKNFFLVFLMYYSNIHPQVQFHTEKPTVDILSWMKLIKLIIKLNENLFDADFFCYIGDETRKKENILT